MKSYTEDYTLGLALFDLVPLALSAIALCLLAHWMQGRFSLLQPAWVGACMTIAGGASKALWKIIVVTTGKDIPIMADALFPLLGGGFTILLVTLVLLRFGMDGAVWPVALGLMAIFYVGALLLARNGEGLSWTTAMLIMTVTSSSLLLLSLSVIGISRRQYVAALLTFTSLGAAFYLARLARIPDQTLSVQWTAELVNTGGQFALLAGAYLLTQATFRSAAS